MQIKTGSVKRVSNINNKYIVSEYFKRTKFNKMSYDVLFDRPLKRNVFQYLKTLKKVSHEC